MHTLPLSDRYRCVVDHWKRIRIYETLGDRLLLEDFRADRSVEVGDAGSVLSFRFDMSVQLPFDVPDRRMVGFESDETGILDGYADPEDMGTSVAPPRPGSTSTEVADDYGDDV